MGRAIYEVLVGAAPGHHEWATVPVAAPTPYAPRPLPVLRPGAPPPAPLPVPAPGDNGHPQQLSLFDAPVAPAPTSSGGGRTRAADGGSFTQTSLFDLLDAA
jgi:hypothetical protein